MSGVVATAVVVVVLVGLPLGAVWLAGRWRDPPRERWALAARPEQEALSEPGMAEFRIRRAHGIRDETRWSVVRRAVDRGEAAPPGLRPATREWAEAVLAGPELREPTRPARRVYWLAPVAGVLGIVAMGVFFGPSTGVAYSVYWLALLAWRNPWRRRARRARAEAARTANS